MPRLENVVFRFATPADAEEIIAFFVREIGSTSAINKALVFEEADSIDVYGPKIRHALPDGLTTLALDGSTKEILGCCIVSRWHRDASQRRTPYVPKTQKSQLLYDVGDTLRDVFWDLCPPHITCIARGDAFLVTTRARRSHIGERLVAMWGNEPFLKANGLQGTVGVSTSLASQRNSANLGSIPVMELDYEEFFRANGVPFEGAFNDGTSKAVLFFRPLDEDRQAFEASLSPRILRVQCGKAKL